MKSKFLIIISLGLLLFASCEPNKEIYDDYYANLKPFSDKFDVTIVETDYANIKKYALANAEDKTDTTNANSLGTNKCFTPEIDAQKIIPYFLDNTYIALDSSSAINVTYKYSYYYKFVSGITINNTKYNSLAEGQAAALANVQTITGTEGTKRITKLNYILHTETVVTPDTVIIDSTWTKSKVFYYHNGTTWTTPENSYILNTTDYQSFGGITATNLSFTDVATADYYIPMFLKEKYPYLSAGASLHIIYETYNLEGNPIYYNQYFYDGSTWTNAEYKTDPFVHNGTAWFYDPTIRYTMVKTDYQIIVDYIINHPTLNVYKDPVFTNNEWYWGASAFYGNYDLRPVKHLLYDPMGEFIGKSDSDILDILLGRISESVVIMCNGKFTDSQPFINGIPVYYEITFDTYEPARHKYMVKCLCTDVGVFEYVSGPTLVQ